MQAIVRPKRHHPICGSFPACIRPQNALLAIAAGLIFAIISGCGLEEVVELYFPTVFSSNGATQITLVHDVNNADLDGSSQSFKGYEIYYRLYDDLAARNAAALALQNNIIGISTMTPDLANSLMLNMGMVRMLGVSTAKPTLKISNTGASQTFILSTADDWTIGGGALYRNKSAGNTQVSFKTRSAYFPADSDYSGASSPQTLYYLMTAVGYGINLSSGSFGTDIYSLPNDFVTGEYTPE